MDKSDHTKVTKIRVGRLEIQSILEENKPSIVENCLIDLRGAGYWCFAKGNGVQWGEYNEGTKVMVDEGAFRLDGLHVLGPSALAERDARIRTEALREAAATIQLPENETAGDPQDNVDRLIDEDRRMIRRAILALIPADQEGDQ